MNSQEFLIVNVTWIGLLVLWYWRSRGAASKGPTTLNMHANDSAPLIIPPENRQQNSELSSALSPFHPLSAHPNGAVPAGNAKNLNIIFNYNGHSWDAYEVLGVPAGSSMPIVTAAYQKALKTAEPASYSFLETAYKSILHRF